MIIRSLEMSDFPQWLPLWNANNQGVVNEAVTTETWGRICDPDIQVFAMGAFEGEVLAGLVQYVVHPITGTIEPVCYMQDVFVDEEHRRKGIARRMVEELARIGKREKWARMYWLAERDNEAAAALYKNIGVTLDFALHILPLK